MIATKRKSDRYYLGRRLDLLDWVGGSYARVLEVGCGAGGNVEYLRKRGGQRIVGVEIDQASVAIAAPLYDDFYAQAIEVALPLLDETFDLILCADVLEHLVDPWSVVRTFRDVAHPDTVLAISTPNIRFYRALLRIAFGSGFRYEEEGTFDSSHLRWFTRGNLSQLLTSTGWTPVRWAVSPPTRFGFLRSWLARLTRGLSNEYLGYQWYVIAVPTGFRTP